jgi:hypothetical protein
MEFYELGFRGYKMFYVDNLKNDETDRQTDTVIELFFEKAFEFHWNFNPHIPFRTVQLDPTI